MKIFYSYFLEEILRMFILGTIVFVSIILMTQFLQLSEFILIHDVSLWSTVRLMGYMCVSFLPIILPMSLIFSVLLTYTRLSADSEIVAFNSFGFSHFRLALPAISFSFVIALISVQTMYTVGPDSRHEFDKAIQEIGGQKILDNLKEKVFIENFFDLVIYFNEKDDKNNIKQVFIRDGREKDHPMIIIAQSGSIFSDKEDLSQIAVLELQNGKAYYESDKSKSITFANYTIKINSPINVTYDSRDTNTYLMREVEEKLELLTQGTAEHTEFLIEWHRRHVIPLSCLIFGFLGAVLGISANRRSIASKGFILSIICLTTYWLLLASSITLANKNPKLATPIMWAPNIMFVLVTAYLWRGSILRRLV